jgi:hypothetical protein
LRLEILGREGAPLWGSCRDLGDEVMLEMVRYHTTFVSKHEH